LLDKQHSEKETTVSAIRFRLDPASGVPTYLQIVQQVEHALRLGYLVEGDQLPRVKDIVAELAINPNTVLKAYRELEYRGLAAGKPGRGTFVVGKLGDASLAGQTVLRRRIARWITEARESGLDDDDIVALFTSALSERRDAEERLALS
jgi:GntR family transcriptional regulator